MTNIDRAAELLIHWADSEGGLSAIDRDYDGDLTGAAEALADAGLLATAPQIIRTVEELEALDPDTVVLDRDSTGGVYPVSQYLDSDECEREVYRRYLPAVVVVPAEQVRAARKALEEA